MSTEVVAASAATQAVEQRLAQGMRKNGKFTALFAKRLWSFSNII
jgi:hypothetical protein